MVGRECFLAFAVRVVLDDEPYRVEHCHAPDRRRVELVAHRFLEHAHVDPRVGLRHADALGEQPESRRRESATARADERRHAGVVPAPHVSLLHKRQKLALAQQRMRQVEAIEFDLPRMINAELLDIPVVERPVVFEFQCADGMRDALD